MIFKCPTLMDVAPKLHVEPVCIFLFCFFVFLFIFIFTCFTCLPFHLIMFFSWLVLIRLLFLGRLFCRSLLWWFGGARSCFWRRTLFSVGSWPKWPKLPQLLFRLSRSSGGRNHILNPIWTTTLGLSRRFLFHSCSPYHGSPFNSIKLYFAIHPQSGLWWRSFFAKTMTWSFKIFTTLTWQLIYYKY